jgi:hypothetical protein
MITTEIAFLAQTAPVVGLIIALFVLYRLLVGQKEATIQLQKENIAFLKDQLADAKLQTPDVLAQSLAGRAQLFEAELKRLVRDNTAQRNRSQLKRLTLHRLVVTPKRSLRRYFKRANYCTTIFARTVMPLSSKGLTAQKWSNTKVANKMLITIGLALSAAWKLSTGWRSIRAKPTRPLNPSNCGRLQA